jgi:hypothetical protein
MHFNKILNSRFNRTIFIGICITLIGGCAGHHAARRVAGLTAESMNELKQETAKFIEEADSLALKNEIRLQQLNLRTLAIRLDTSTTSSAWGIAKDERASWMFSAMTKVGLNEVAAQSTALTLQKPASDIVKNSFSAGQYDDLVRRLSNLATASSFTETVNIYIDIGNKVKNQFNGDAKKAEDGLSAGDEESKKAFDGLLNPSKNENNN